MAEKDFDPNNEEVWDEYAWERFLQQQDRNTEKYFTLLEQYMDHPERDEIIAREMGWERYSDEESEIEVSIEFSADENILELQASEFEDLASFPVYQEALDFQTGVNLWLEKRPDLKEHPEAIRLSTASAICGAKLAAALCGGDYTEIGMTIAYLKRSLKAANDSLNAIAYLFQQKLLPFREQATFSRQLFYIRDHVVKLIGDWRTEWRHRYGA